MLLASALPAPTADAPYALLSNHRSGSSQADMFVSLACDLMASPNILGPGGEGASPRGYQFHHCQGASPARSRRGSHDGGASPAWNQEWSPKQPRKRLGRWSLDGNDGPAEELAVAWARLREEHSSDAQWLIEREGDRGSGSGVHDGGDVEGGALQPLLSAQPGCAAGLAGGQLAMTPRRQRRRWGAHTQASLRIAWEHMRLSYDEIPDWMRDNCLIQGHYRPQLTLAAAARSLLSLHNETFNVWSHLAGCAAALLVLLAVSREQPPQPTAGAAPSAGSPKWPMYVSLATSVYMYLVSSAAHLFHVVGKAASDLLWRLDHTAIAVSCAGAFFPICTYAFPCSAQTTATYISVTCLLALLVISLSLLPAFHMPKYRPVRAAVQLSFGIWAQVPLMHATWLLLKHTAALSALLLVYAALGVLVLGAVIFASRATDRLFPGRVDLIGSSHNILHALVVVSNLLFIAGARELWLWSSTASSAC